MRLWIELAAAASQSDHPAHTYFVERYERGRNQFAEGFHDEAARSRLRKGIRPESAAILFHAVLNGLQLQWVLDQDLDIVGSRPGSSLHHSQGTPACACDRGRPSALSGPCQPQGHQLEGPQAQGHPVAVALRCHRVRERAFQQVRHRDGRDLEARGERRPGASAP